MRNRKLIKLLKELDTTLNESIKYLNYGGCGFVASLISQELSKRNINHNYTYLDGSLHEKCNTYNEGSFNKRKFLNSELNHKYFSAGHVTIRLGRYIFNQDNINKLDFISINKKFNNELTENITKSYDTDIWNPTFVNCNNVSRVKKIIINTFKKYDSLCSA